MKDEIKEIKLWKEKTKGIFHIIEYTKFWNYITNLQDYNSRIENVIEDIQHELSHLKENDEVSWNEEFYTNNKLDYRKLCIALLEYVVNKLKGVDKDEN